MDIKIIYVVLGWSKLSNTKVAKYLNIRLNTLGYKVKYPDPDKVLYFSISKLLGLEVDEVVAALKRDDFFTCYNKFTNMKDVCEIQREVLYALHSDIFINHIIKSLKVSSLNNVAIIDKLNTYREFELLKVFCITNGIKLITLNPHSEHGNIRNNGNQTLSLITADYRFKVDETTDYMLKLDDIVEENELK